MKKEREVHRKTAWHRGRESKRNTKHYFWQPLRASPSVTLITIQLREEGYSIRHSGTQPGSCGTVGRASTPPLSQVWAFWPLSVPLPNCIAWEKKKKGISRWSAFTIFITRDFICVKWQLPFSWSSSALLCYQCLRVKLVLNACHTLKFSVLLLSCRKKTFT